MGLMCAIGGHEAAPREVYNCGYWFSRCRGCGRDMIRAGGAWSLVPDGHRVAWKAGRQSHSIPTDFAHALPVLLPAANLPAPRPLYLSWSRVLTRRTAKPAAAPPVEGDGSEPHYPVLLLIAAVVGAGLQVLLGIRRNA